MNDWLIDQPAQVESGQPDLWYLFAHGAGAPMDSEFMNALTAGLVARGVGVVRFEFPYMVERRQNGTRRPPNRMDDLLACFQQAIDRCRAELNPQRLLVGGKSMGGRVATMLAESAFEQSQIDGVVCLGYPFHPQGKPDKLRTAHLQTLSCPTLIVQGSRDPLGNRREVADYGLSKAIRVEWLEDGDHDFKPRRASGLVQSEHWRRAGELAARFIQRTS